MARTLIATLLQHYDIFCVVWLNRRDRSWTAKLTNCKHATQNSQPMRRSTATQTAGCTEPRWLWNISQKFKKEKVWTFNVLRTNSWALFPLSFWEEKKKKTKEKRSGPGAGCASIYQRRPHPSAAVRYNRHSWYRKWLRDSHFTELALRLCHHPRLYPVRRRASADLHLAIWRWGGGEKEELALPSSESRTEMEFFFFFFLILFPFPSYHIQLSNSILCKAFSGTGMCVWWINQQT